METKIIEFAEQHPIWFTVAVPIILGVVVSFLIEFVKYIFYGKRSQDEKQFTAFADNIVWRITTVVVSLIVAILTLFVVADVFEDIYLMILFVILNSSVPFAFYHTYGKQLIALTLGKLFDKFTKVNL